MNLEAEKIALIKWVTTIEDQDVVRKLSLIKKESEFELTDDHKKILDERLRDFENNPAAGSSWEEVRNRLPLK